MNNNNNLSDLHSDLDRLILDCKRAQLYKKKKKLKGEMEEILRKIKYKRKEGRHECEICYKNFDELTARKTDDGVLFFCDYCDAKRKIEELKKHEEKKAKA